MYSRLVWSVYAPSLLLAIAGQIGFILLPLYVLELGEGPAVASFVTAGIGVGMVLFDVPAGFLISRFGDKRIMMSAVVAAAFTSFAIAATDQPSVLFLLALLRGAASAAWILSLLSFLTDFLAANQRGRAIAVMGGTLRVGALIGPYCGGLVASSFGYGYAFGIAGALAVVGAFVISRQRYGVHERELTNAHAGARFVAVLKDNRHVFATAGFASIGLQLMRAARQLLIPLVGYTIGLDAATIGLIFSLSAAIDMLLFYPAGVAMDRFGRKSVGVPCMLLFALGIALMPLVSSFYTLLGVALTVGVANGLGSGIVLTIGSDLAPRQRRGEFLGVWRFVGDVGNASAPVIIGGLISLASLGMAAAVIAAIGTSGAAVLALLVKETLTQSGDSGAAASPPDRGGTG